MRLGCSNMYQMFTEDVFLRQVQWQFSFAVNYVVIKKLAIKHAINNIFSLKRSG